MTKTATATKIDDGGPAFPSLGSNVTRGMSLRDYFAIRAPEATEEWVKGQAEIDRVRNPHGDYYKPRRRSAMEIRAQWRYQYADAMIEARQRRDEA